MKTSIVLLCVILGGCAECQRQPVVCAVAVSTAVISGAIIATERNKHPEREIKRVRHDP